MYPPLSPPWDGGEGERADRFRQLHRYGSSLPAEADVVVQVQQIKPAVDIFAGGGELAQQFAEEFARFHVARSAGFLVGAPGRDLPGLPRVRGGLLNPLQDLAVAKPLRQLAFQSFDVDAGELDKPLVQRTVEVVFAVLPDQSGPAFIEHAGQEGVSPKALTRTA